MRMAMLAAAAVWALFAPPAGAAEARPEISRALDAAFGAGRWRITGGYRTPERENQLRAEGALTVRAGRLSRHSVGGHANPGAYDIVVDGLSPTRAAERLRAVGAPFARYLPKGPHGTQGPHLHVEMPHGSQMAAGAAPRPSIPVVHLTEAEAATHRMSREALEGAPEAQLALGRAYMRGDGVRADPVSAYVWLGMAASNVDADDAIRRSATEAWETVSARLTPTQLASARRFVGDPQLASSCSRPRTVMVLLIGSADAPYCEPARTSDR